MSEISPAKLDRSTATDLFIQKLIQHAYQGTVQDTRKLLEQGPGWPSPEKQDIELHRWFIELDAENQKRALQLVEEAASAAIFHTLAIFDGAAGSLIPGKITELLIQLRVYNSVQQARSHSPAISIELNPAGAPRDELHDLFQHMIARTSLKNRP